MTLSLVYVELFFQTRFLYFSFCCTRGSDQTKQLSFRNKGIKKGLKTTLNTAFYGQKAPLRNFGANMARANRHYTPDCAWHITHRCHQREFLLKYIKDRQRWLLWLYEAKKRFDDKTVV